MFDKILIANRGEIACRIIKTARQMDIRTVAVFSDADAQARHVRLADEAVYIGAAPPRESYLDGAKIIAVAQATGAQAIHPGYGFLSENEAFCLACAQAGIVFIGPPVEAIRVMGLKSQAKKLMGAAGIPLIPGYHGEDQTPENLQREADAIGYPVLIKASAGGGGKGMRLVERSEDFTQNLFACQREAQSAFGDDHVLIERYITRPRHIEIQIFGDSHGNYVSLFERDCSVQRRHQKIVEEAPAPHFSEQQRRIMGKAATDAARAVHYTGAGTVEFIVAPDGQFYFMEMNTRLQVEHPVTEMITGLDLVEWQLRVASGEKLPVTQEDLSHSGHAIEARIYAEDPSAGFLPSTGKLVHFQLPEESAHVRVDAGVEEGDAISRFYDPMIAKLIVWDETRDKALRRMERALADTQVAGIASNIEFLSRLVRCRSFTQADLDTGLIERETAALFPEVQEPPAEVFLLAALAQLLHEADEAPLSSFLQRRDGFRLNTQVRRDLNFRYGAAQHIVTVTYLDTGYRLQTGSLDVTATGRQDKGNRIIAEIDGLRKSFTAVRLGSFIHLFTDGQSWKLEWLDPLDVSPDHAASHDGLVAPMPGSITALLVEQGQQVAKGTPLLIVEAMKMEFKITAPAAGYVKAFRCAVGDQVNEGTELADFELADGEAKEQLALTSQEE
ncbi:acetyl/propionyl/methylcrotonyl-CoA carboxylase subunit alpha [Pseudochrobactrum sp. sp1633]|uniref:acetyl/propionyl/methylcrotonyl-CoA carboxylase subunit alpha n=1 Tax=Pseudochrobactrum sp. sp1633 TaxID=3036706 RepID=UPI0025A53B66|nr:acetyl/propionyl/methylcrotonyl-CoA carboxylase subunit alpha [Pseudochrobactrum sp. sp1633]HWD14243.1 acetyl/propionyl/methylcrotonyl-CoA carboxylase subunit alpha [Pseudochrobactrum sp.]